MGLKERYVRAMEALYIVCIVISGIALVVITLIIPLGVFMRYVMNSPLSWPEPAAVIMMVTFSFLGGAAVYRARGHVAVQALLNAVGPQTRRLLSLAVYACMLATASFMLVYGVHLCMITWHQSIAEFPGLSVGLTYSPIPVSGALTLLFIVEQMWAGALPRESWVFRDGLAEIE